MKFKEIPNTDRPLWLNWRHEGIGSSDAAVIMEVSRFKNYDDLLAEKAVPFTGEDQANEYIKERGNKIEKLVRELFEKEKDLTYSAMSCESNQFNFMRATLDGITPDKKTIIEIKLLSVFNPEKPNTKTDGYLKWEAAKNWNVVPEEYYPQLQHQLMVTQADRCIFLGLKDVKGQAITMDNLAVIEVLPDPGYTKALAIKEFMFWYRVGDKKRELEYKGDLG